MFTTSHRLNTGLVQRSGRAYHPHRLARHGRRIEIGQLRCTLRRQLQLRTNPIHLTREGTDAAALFLVAHQSAARLVDPFPFSLTSEASQVGVAACFVSAFVYSWLSNGDEQECAKTAKYLHCVNRHVRLAPAQQSPASLWLPQFGPLCEISRAKKKTLTVLMMRPSASPPTAPCAAESPRDFLAIKEVSDAWHVSHRRRKSACCATHRNRNVVRWVPCRPLRAVTNTDTRNPGPDLKLQMQIDCGPSCGALWVARLGGEGPHWGWGMRWGRRLCAISVCPESGDFNLGLPSGFRVNEWSGARPIECRSPRTCLIPFSPTCLLHEESLLRFATLPLLDRSRTHSQDILKAKNMICAAHVAASSLW